MNESKWLTLEDFKFLCFDLARELLSYGEPIPDYETRDDSLLASALGVPQQTFDGEYLYPQASALFYSLIKNHPFQNGNKRIAVMGLLAFLGLNDKWVDMSEDKMYHLAIDVSNSHPSHRESVLEQIEKSIIEHVIDFPKS